MNVERRRLLASLLFVGVLAASVLPAAKAGALDAQQRGAVALSPCPIPGTDEEMLCGSLDVYENRGTGRGRKISLRIAVLPARAERARPDPVFWIAGGPGGAATVAAERFASHWMREQRDVVLVDQRGTGGSNPLPCTLPGSAEDVQGYLEGSFSDVGLLRRCKRELKDIANLRMYTTDNTVDDLDEVRAAMSYGRINLLAGSWGTRTALVYLRRHGETIRRAIFNGAVPLALTYPLYHADGAQRALDLLFDRCAADAGCASAFPNLAEEFQALLDRLDQGAARVEIDHPSDPGTRVTVELDRTAFAEALRYLMNGTESMTWIPYLVHRAFEGDFEPIAQFAVEITAFYNERLQTGLLLSVVCSEDVPRINPARIPRLTEGTFFGDRRVYETIEICNMWPKSPLPPGWGEPISSDVPVLIWSGAFDPSLPPKWGGYVARHLPRSLHLVVPFAHGVSGPCFEAVNQRFFDRRSIDGLNTACTEALQPPPFELPN